MACEIITSAGAVFALWGKPTRDDLMRVQEELKKAAREAGHPVIYVARIPLDAPAPDAEVRKYISSIMPSLIKCFSSYHVIMEGAGFMAAVKRGVLTSLLQPIWKKKVFYVHAESREVIATLSGKERAIASELLHRAQGAGMLSGAAPSSVRPKTAGAQLSL